ncbi:hypothetical protein F7725_026304 [Dissostichus mawsoni]|uniref:Uncharacterized protein n=1 Tax=Dissostichus mawsoni TaxID=36200 RepID=A0A7J5X7M4_DISMA|nr:hypothetical protein F7725_026304 [Dissostichus mawsoni]
MLDHIAHEVGLKKRVVQVCSKIPELEREKVPFCRALFKAKTALEAHIALVTGMKPNVLDII